jgi:lycopene beta-cyclase
VSRRPAVAVREERGQDVTAAWDLVLVGGGLANALLAWRLRQRRPGVRVLLLERGRRLGGNHTWSFFDTDVTPDQRAWLDPLVEHRWPGYAVRFPGFDRRLDTPYNSISSGRLHDVVSAALDADCWAGVEVASISPGEVRLTDGRRVTAPGVIDGRGLFDDVPLLLGYQKFVGIEVRLDRPHGLEGPLVMDATVAQEDGFRFVYVLPLGAERVLVEDTRYSDGPALDARALRTGAEAYIAARGWRVRERLREESGVLPIALGGDIDAVWDHAPAGVPRSGLRAALFHPTTGYSLPDAAALADLVAALPDLSSSRLLAVTREHSRTLWGRRRFFRMLNRMLFRAGEPARRHRVFRRFYTLPQALIERFYAARPTPADRMRLLIGRPPIPVLPALRCVPEPRAVAGGSCSS